MLPGIVPWISPNKPWPLKLCAVFRCRNPRWEDPKHSHWRRWCVFHTRCYEIEVEEQGGATVLEIGDYAKYIHDSS